MEMARMKTGRRVVHMDVDTDFSVIEAIRKTGRKTEDYVKSSTIGLVTVDYYFYKKALQNLKPEKALELYSDAWNQYIEKKVQDFASKMGMSGVDSIPNLGRITRAFFDDRCRPLKAIEDTPKRYIGIVVICPFVEYTTSLFKEEIGCKYHKILAKHSERFLNLLVDLSELKDRVEAKQDKFICLGDSVCRIIFQKKN